MSSTRIPRLRAALSRPADDHPMSRGAFWMMVAVILLLFGLYCYFNFLYVPAAPPTPWPPELCCR